MTRKQAILQAIAILEKEGKNQEICVKLSEILEDLPLAHWSDKSIFDALDQFILENDSLPTRSEISATLDLPKHTVVKNRFGLTMQEFYKKYYSEYVHKCKSRVYHYRSPESWIEDFKEQYAKNNEPSQREYDLMRRVGSPCSRHLFKITGCKTWNELLFTCGFKVKTYTPLSTIKTQKTKTNYKINLIRNLDVTSEQIKDVNDKLQEILKNHNK